MAPLFDQDSSPNAEGSPAERAGPAIAGHSETGPSVQSSEERVGYPDGADAVGQPALGGQDGVGEPGPRNEADATKTSVDRSPADNPAGDGDANPPAESGAGPGDTTDGTTPADGTASPAEPGEPVPVPPERVEDEASSAEHAELDDAATPSAAPAEPVTPASAEPAATAPSWPLPPPPSAEPASPTAWAPPAPAAPAEAEPAAPATAEPTPPAAEPTKVVPAAPSSAGPAPFQPHPERPARPGVAGRLASRIRLLARWPSPVRATPDQRGYSLVMLFVLAVTVGVVGAGILLGLVFFVVGALGHGSGS